MDSASLQLHCAALYFNFTTLQSACFTVRHYTVLHFYWTARHRTLVIFTVLNRNALYYNVLHFNGLHFAVLHCTVLLAECCISLYSTALHSTGLHNRLALHFTELHCWEQTVLHCTVVHFTLLHCTLERYILMHCTTFHCTTQWTAAWHCKVMHFHSKAKTTLHCRAGGLENTQTHRALCAHNLGSASGPNRSARERPRGNAEVKRPRGLNSNTISVQMATPWLRDALWKRRGSRGFLRDFRDLQGAICDIIK